MVPYDGIYYILKRKGKKRVDLKALQEYKQNLSDWKYWDQLINGSADSIFQTAQRKHADGNLIIKSSQLANIKLKPRQKYAAESVQGRILDLGCFDGRFVCYLIQKGFDCYGVDFNDHYLQLATDNLKSLGVSKEKIRKGLFQDIPFEDGWFDTVVSQETLEHFYYPDIMLAEIKRVLKPGGIFIGSVPFENRIDSPSHIIYYTYRGIESLLLKFFKKREMITLKSRSTDKIDKLILWVAYKR
jgi:ubiquinone/menaquinone biosynthesis C-methylase UbiE